MCIVSASRTFAWTLAVGVTSLLFGPVVPSLAQPTTSVGTPEDCQIQLQVANPAPGTTAVPQSLMVSGTAFDQRSTSGNGVREIQAFAGPRDEGGFFLGNASFADATVPNSWSLAAKFPDSATGNLELFVYAISSVNGQEAAVGIPIVVGPGQLDRSPMPAIVCPATLSQQVLITNIDWMWTAATDSAGEAMSVDSPNQYTLTLNPDGTFHARADCNLTAGGFTLQGGDLSFTLGPTTLAECPPGSLFSQYLSNLGFVSGFVVDDGGNLVLSLGDSGATMVFTPASSALAR